jgi:hypothetical protein
MMGRAGSDHEHHGESTVDSAVTPAQRPRWVRSSATQDRGAATAATSAGGEAAAINAPPGNVINRESGSLSRTRPLLPTADGLLGGNQRRHRQRRRGGRGLASSVRSGTHSYVFHEIPHNRQRPSVGIDASAVHHAARGRNQANGTLVVIDFWWRVRAPGFVEGRGTGEVRRFRFV